MCSEAAASNRHGERIGCECQRKQQRPRMVEPDPINLLSRRIDGEESVRKKKDQQPQRQVDQEDRLPTEFGDQHAAERWTECGADRGHRSKQSHGAADL